MRKLIIGFVAAIAAAVSFTSFAEDDWTGLPDSYVEYVQATGQQYIDTGIRAAAPLEIDTEVMWDEGGAGTLLLARTADVRFYLLYNYNGNWSFGYGDWFDGYHSAGANLAITIGQKYSVQVKFAAGEQTLLVNNEKIYDCSAASDLSIDWNLPLFCQINSSGQATDYCKAKCYSLKMWQDGELKRDFRPCVKNNEACLYDLVSKTYFRSKTATPLVAGPELKMIVDKIPTAIYREGKTCEPKVVVRTASDGVLGPDRYDVAYENNTSIGTATAVVTGKGALAGCVVRRDFLIDYDWTGEPDYFIEYVQATQPSTTSMQFIDTGFRPSPPFKVETELTFDELRDGEFMYLGARTQTARYYLAYLYNMDWGFGYGEAYKPSDKVPGAPKPAAGERYKCVVNFESGSQTMVVNDQQIFNLNIASDFSIPRTLTLFANNAWNGLNCPVKGKCHSLKIWQGEELKCDFLPCVKNGEACLYDQVSGGFFRNKNKENPLVAGPGVDWTGKPEYYVEYLQSTEQGKQWINTGVPAKSPFKIDVSMELDRSSGENCFLACRNDNTRLYAIYSTGGNWVSGYGSNFFDTSKKVPGAQTATQAGVLYRVQTEMKNGSQTLIINDATLYDQKVDGDFEVNGKTFPIFAGTDASGNINYHTPAKCYSCKMWQGGELKRDFRPCVKNGEPCLLDLVTGEYFRNEAETPFVAGPKCAGPSRGLMLILR